MPESQCKYFEGLTLIRFCKKSGSYMTVLQLVVGNVKIGIKANLTACIHF